MHSQTTEGKEMALYLTTAEAQLLYETAKTMYEFMQGSEPTSLGFGRAEEQLFLLLTHYTNLHLKG